MSTIVYIPCYLKTPVFQGGAYIHIFTLTGPQFPGMARTLWRVFGGALRGGGAGTTRTVRTIEPSHPVQRANDSPTYGTAFPSWRPAGVQSGGLNPFTVRLSGGLARLSIASVWRLMRSSPACAAASEGRRRPSCSRQACLMVNYSLRPSRPSVASRQTLAPPRSLGAPLPVVTAAVTPTSC
jgi:hypothetical protein